MQQHLKTQLETALNPTYLEVINESHQHSGPASDSHFKLIVVSADFTDLSLLKRHRFINQLFAAELTQIHALAMHTYTPEEWALRGSAPDSPKCASTTKS